MDNEGIPTYAEVMDEFYSDIAKKDEKVLRKAKRYLSRERYDLLLEELENEALDIDLWLKDVVNESSVNKKLRQDCVDESLISDYHYCNQTTGYICDDYSGTVWLPISGKKKKHRKCLVYTYSC